LEGLRRLCPRSAGAVRFWRYESTRPETGSRVTAMADVAFCVDHRGGVKARSATMTFKEQQIILRRISRGIWLEIGHGVGKDGTAVGHCAGARNAAGQNAALHEGPSKSSPCPAVPPPQIRACQNILRPRRRFAKVVRQAAGKMFWVGYKPSAFAQTGLSCLGHGNTACKS